MGTELWQESATELARRIRDGETSAREVCESHLSRIEAVNTDLNAVVEVRPDEVRREADAADAARNAGEPLGALHGVPFSVKVNIDVATYTTNEGSVALKDLMASTDSPSVERMRRAGGVMLARTNMPDLGLRINTESALFGATHNPWRRGYTAGGSSGGEASAIASGMSPLGLGNDIGGSLRNPAYACGISSIKPSRGRVAQVNDSALIEMPLSSQLMLVQGVLARHVADVRTGLEVVMGADPRDPLTLSAPLRGPSAPRRVALVPSPSGGSTDAAVAEGVRVAGRALEAAGYEVDEIEPPKLVETYLSWSELMLTSLKVDEALLFAVIGEGGRKFIELTDIGFPPATSESLYRMHQARFALARAWRAFLSEYPLIVGPTWTQPPFAHGFDIESRESALSVVELFRFVLPANLLGLPAACVPTGVANGFPTGAQIIGDLFREDLCLDAAEVVEASVGVLTPIDPRT
ncbi:MAG: amidase [Acidimicrobiales bacterium]